MFYAGLDLGQRRDFSAIAVVERKDTAATFRTPAVTELLVRHLERVPLGTPYPRVVARMREVVRSADLRGQCALVVDATGVGAAVVEMLRAAELGCEITAVTITGSGRQQAYSQAGGAGYSVPKQDLLAAVQVPLENGELRIAQRLREAGTLMKELMNVRATPGRAGRVRLGADGCGEHDDLVIALALACWRARRKRLQNGVQRLPGI